LRLPYSKPNRRHEPIRLLCFSNATPIEDIGIDFWGASNGTIRTELGPINTIIFPRQPFRNHTIDRGFHQRPKDNTPRNRLRGNWGNAVVVTGWAKSAVLATGVQPVLPPTLPCASLSR